MVEANFVQWWSSEDVDGVTPRLYIHSLLDRVSKSYKLHKFSFSMSLPEVETRITKYFYLLFKIVNQNLSKKIEGPNCYIKQPDGWTARDEAEWLDAHCHYFDTIFWERTFGPEKTWEQKILEWRHVFPIILQKYTVRSRDNLPHDDYYDEDEDYESNHEWE
jgi:hypothetical protein